MRILVAGLVLVGCASRPATRPPPPDDEEEEPPPVEEPRIRGLHGEPLLPPPTFRLIGMTDAPTWPLVHAPTLEPHYRIASPWYAACDKRGRLPDDVLVYIETWCRFRTDPRFDVAAALLKLRSSLVPNLAEGVKRDIANRLAEDYDANGALAWGHIDQFLDHLRAVYIDLQRYDDATVIATEIRTKHGHTCGRAVADLTFNFKPMRGDFVFNMAHAYGVDTPCGKYIDRLGCIITEAQVQAHGELAHHACLSSLDQDEVTATRAIAARIRWDSMREESELIEIAELAASALSMPDAEGLALSALEGALKFSCDFVPQVQVIASRIQRAPDAQERFDKRRSRLMQMTPAQCEPPTSDRPSRK